MRKYKTVVSFVPVKSASLYFVPVIKIENQCTRIDITYDEYHLFHVNRYVSKIFWRCNNIGIRLLSCIGERIS
jgi:hypothetical protein